MPRKKKRSLHGVESVICLDANKVNLIYFRARRKELTLIKLRAFYGHVAKQVGPHISTTSARSDAHP